MPGLKQTAARLAARASNSHGCGLEARQENGMKAAGRAVPILLSVAIVSVLESFASVEWSSPSCSHAYQSWNGPISAVFGFPFPYMRWSLASSLHYLVMVHVYLLDIALLSGAAYPLVRMLTARIRKPFVRLTVGGTAVVLCGLMVALRVHLVASSVWSPVGSMAFAEPYFAFRPVGVTGTGIFPRYECRPSPFWFGKR
jgi:hypothetical protein